MTPAFDIQAVLEWNCDDVVAADIIREVWQRSMDYRSTAEAPWIGRLWNDARKWLVARRIP